MICKLLSFCLTPVCFVFLACSSNSSLEPSGEERQVGSIRMNIDYAGYTSTLFVDIPEKAGKYDALLIFHGTTLNDADSIIAAETFLQRTKDILLRDDLIIISVGYKEENILLGDEIAEAEAMLLWVLQQASVDLGITLNKTYLLGHSRGGYLVTRLNSLHATDGVIANAPGPIDLVFRCGLEERGDIQPGQVCGAIRNAHGTTVENPSAYYERSLLNFTTGLKSRMLFVQGLLDSPIQLSVFPNFIEMLNSCVDCAEFQVVEIENAHHAAMFDSVEGFDALNEFLAK